VNPAASQPSLAAPKTGLMSPGGAETTCHQQKNGRGAWKFLARWLTVCQKWPNYRADGVLGGTEVNKAQLIEALAERLGDKKAASSAVDGIVDIVVRTVQKGEKVNVTGFGVFEKRARAARTARNPRTGETVKVKKTNVPAFRAGTTFKDVISGAKKLPKAVAAKPAAAAKATTTAAAAAKPATTTRRTAAAKPAAAAAKPATTRRTAAAKPAAAAAKPATTRKAAAPKRTTAAAKPAAAAATTAAAKPAATKAAPKKAATATAKKAAPKKAAAAKK